MIKYLETLFAILFARPFFQRFFQYLYVASLKGMGYLNYRNLTLTGERNVVRSINLRKSPTVFDVGAADNEDFLSEIYSKYPKAKVYSFEPNEQAYNKLVSMVPNNLVKVYPYGLGNKNQVLKLYDYDDGTYSQHASVYRSDISKSNRQKKSSRKIMTKKLDTFTRLNGISYIDFLKIDVEGFELSVLKGAKRMIEAKKIKYIQFEFNEMNVSSNVFMRDFIKILPNYHLYRMLPNALVPIDPYIPWLSEIFAFHNILAVRNK